MSHAWSARDWHTRTELLISKPGWQLNGLVFYLHCGCLEVIGSSLPHDCKDSATLATRLAIRWTNL